MKWTLEIIKNLASESDTFDKAISLAVLRQWQVLESDESQIWGLCKLSDNRVINSCVSLEKPIAVCNCAASQSFCCHSLALLLIHIKHPDAFTIKQSAPEWAVIPLVTSSSEIKDTKSSLQNVSSRHQKRNQRIEQMTAGFADLENWLFDLLRQGLGELSQQSPDFWEEIAARMVDVKLGSIGRRLRQLGKQPSDREDWPEQMLAELSAMYLLAQSFRQYKSLSHELQQEVLTQAGVSSRRDELLSLAGVKGRWQLMSRQETMEDNLIARRIWFQSIKDGKWALLLEFVHHSSTFQEEWPQAAVFDGELVYFPSLFPHRAIIKSKLLTSEPYSSPIGYQSFFSLLKGYSTALAQHPWLQEFPCYIHSVRPVWKDVNLYLVDANGYLLPTKFVSTGKEWTLLAISGGKPIGVFGEWSGLQFLMLSCWYEDRLVHL